MGLCEGIDGNLYLFFTFVISLICFKYGKTKIISNASGFYRYSLDCISSVYFVICGNYIFYNCNHYYLGWHCFYTHL